MKVKVTTIRPESEKDFPKLMIYSGGEPRYNGLVILFSTERGGMVIQGRQEHHTGEVSETWSKFNFVDFHGTIELSQ